MKIRLNLPTEFDEKLIELKEQQDNVRNAVNEMDRLLRDLLCFVVQLDLSDDGSKETSE